MISEMDFHTDTGRRCLDLAATLGDRFGSPLERLVEPESLAEWFASVAGSPLPAKVTSEDLATVRNLRDSIGRVADALYDNQAPDVNDIARINDHAATFPSPPRLALDGRSVMASEDTTLEAVLGEIARDAIDLLSGPDFAKVKRCAAEDCSVLFVDYSRPGKRRWCSMSRCGNRAKKRAYNARQKPSDD
ncbi:MAG: CGNR zinc finger domain-containing protein [Alphaproteobacteria bacterium]|nr:CGNR zinc finger domain-containing protein [Alphaproteobacteria bacterium]